MYGYIYKTTNLVNGKIYVGKKERNEFDPTYYGSGLLLNEDLKTFGICNFKIEILQWCKTLKTLNSAEKKWIKKLNCQNKEIGYNISSGGDGGNTLKYLSEEKLKERSKKISSKLKNRTFSEERIKHMQEGALKYYSNPENKLKWEERNKQRLLDNPDIGQKISEAQKQRFKENPELRQKRKIEQFNNWKNPNYINKQKQTRKSQAYLNKMSSLHNNLDKIRIYKEDKELLVDKNVLNNYLQDGWVKGRKPFSEETKMKMRESALNRRKK